MIKIICKFCKKEFLNYFSNHRQFCSLECKHKAQKGVAIHSEEFKNKMSKEFTGKNNPFYGKKHTIETKDKISKSGKGKHSGRNNHFYGVKRRSEDTPNWKGGIIRNKRGYFFINNPSHPFCRKSGYVLRSRLVMEKKLGRYLTRKEIVHHKGIEYPVNSFENKGDDRIENLQLLANNAQHCKMHNPAKK